MGRDPKAHERGLIHGGAGAERRLSTGEPLIGIARDMELAVSAEVETDGIEQLYKKRAARLQACADLYWSAILAAEGMERLDALVKRWGWLQSSALRAWQVYREIERSRPAADITTFLSGGRE